MANHGGGGGAGNKFVSVNLNKSYGKLSGLGGSSSYGAAAAASRVRPGGQIGGGMVVLSRPRSSQKPGQKLSVPSPVNLPSMRKEHEKFDLTGAGSGVVGGGTGSNVRPSSAGMGWTKPATVVLQEKEKTGETPPSSSGGVLPGADGVSRGSSVYLPPARSSSVADTSGSAQGRAYTPVERVAILRGEDFPSLHTALVTGSGHTQKQKEGSSPKQKQVPADNLTEDYRDNSHHSIADTLHQDHHSQNSAASRPYGNDVGHSGPKSSEDAQKPEGYFHGPLPEVRLNPRSDWADDERDTGHVATDRTRNYGSQKTEEYWDRDFDMPRGSLMPPKPSLNVFNKCGQRDDETGKMPSSEVFKADSYKRDMRPTSKEGWELNSWNNYEFNGREGRDSSSWRSSSTSVMGAYPQKVVSDVNGSGAKPNLMKREMTNDNRFVASNHTRDDSINDRGYTLDRKDTNYLDGGRQRRNNTTESLGSQMVDRAAKDHYGGDRYHKYRGNNYQNGSPAKSSFSVGSKGLSVNDPILNFSKVKKPMSKTDDLSLEDPFSATGFDGRDLFSGRLIGVVKRKKDVPKLTDVHDPARESFEAELERVQKMQEQERQRAIDEQEKAFEFARREEEERMRLAREQEERQMRLEEEAREAAWRAEQEQVEAIRRAEELRIAREEEKQRLQMEEERRMQAAKQKLLELEEKIARRQAEATKEDEGKEKESSRAVDISDWEDCERMVERITTSASSNSSGLNRFLDSESRPQISAELPGRGKSVNPWTRDAYENEGSSNFILHDQVSGHHSSRRDTTAHAQKPIASRDVHGGQGVNYPQTNTKVGVHEPDMNDPLHRPRWNFPSERDHYSSNPEFDTEVHDSFSEKFGDSGWGAGRPSHHAHSIYQERPYQNPEAGEVYSYSRSRYSVRQPRVLPPPSLASLHRSSDRRETEQPGVSASRDREPHGNIVRDPALQTGYDSSRLESLADPEMVGFHPEHAPTREQTLDNNNSVRCDSQSSLSVTSPPSSPTHLSHEDLDDSGGTPDSSAATGVKAIQPSSNDPGIRNGSFLTADDDEDWIMENRENLQEQEVYDEGGEYQEVDEVHADEDDIDLNEEFEALNLEGKDSPRMSDNFVLGFNEGIEVAMPSDQSEETHNEKSKFSAPHLLSHLEDGSQHSKQSDSGMQVTEELMDGSIIHPKLDPPSSLSLVSADAIVSTGRSLPTLSVPYAASQTVMSSGPAVPSHPEIPVNLQFGLFSGPSLIQSPVPAIQIGSIQMPLHLHLPLGPSLPHQSTPLFQFGQLRHNSPISQGILPLAPKAISFVQPSLPGQFTTHNHNGHAPVQPVQNSSQSGHANNCATDSMDNHVSNKDSSLPAGSNPLQPQVVESDKGPGSDMNLDGSLLQVSAPSDIVSSIGDGQHRSRVVVTHQFPRERVMARSKAPGPISRGQGRETFSNGRSFGSRSSNFAPVSPRVEPSGSYRRPQRNGQRSEFQVQENADGRLPEFDKKMYGVRDARASVRSGSKKGVFMGKHTKQINESGWQVAGTAGVKDSTSGSKTDKEANKSTGQGTSVTEEGLPKEISEEDMNVPLQSGIVRVFEQPGIEVPSDEDDFIEVRSKRQMLNDRREQREKDKAKSRLMKNIQKRRPISQNIQVARYNNKTASYLSRVPTKEIQANHIVPEGKGGLNSGASTTGFNIISVSQPLAPIGTPSPYGDGLSETSSRVVKSVQTSGLSIVSTTGKSMGAGLSLENKSSVMENLGSWNNAWVSQQVMPLTQSQLDDAMKPVRFDAHTSSTGNHPGSVGMSVPSSSNLMKDKSFSSAASPINSLLAGEKIQFGAVTSPTILPPSSRAVSHGIGPSRSDQVSRELSALENGSSFFNEKEKRPNESCINMGVSESEAEAAASAVAVAAITSDDVIGTIGVSDAKCFGGARVDGMSDNQKSRSQLRTDESLSVSLPADLSVETPPMSLWQPLQSPQNASNQMISHFPGGHPSQFPFYEMNPMLGGPIFAYGPHDDASGSQSQSQKNSTSVSASLGPWQQRHSGADSFYGHPAGFTGPFISQPGGIPGAQGPPHMVVYNHFAPVGQYGQVGLSFMGTTYVPSGKQPDRKHNPPSSAGEESRSNIVMNPGQHVPHSMPAPIQLLAPGHSMLPVAPPLAMFDVSPYHQVQPSPDMSGPARWSHIPAPHLHAMPPLIPLQQQQEENLVHSQLGHGPPQDKASVASNPIHANRFPDSRNSAVNSAPATQLSADLGLVESSNSAPFDSATSKSISKGNLSTDAATEADKLGVIHGGGSNNNSQNMNSGVKIQSSQQKNLPFQQYGHSTGYNYHRGGGPSQRNGAGGNWPHRRTGYHSRNQSTEKGFHPSKVKQIYVPKQTANLTSSSTS